jgi:hypothetical protein
VSLPPAAPKESAVGLVEYEHVPPACVTVNG